MEEISLVLPTQKHRRWYHHWGWGIVIVLLIGSITGGFFIFRRFHTSQRKQFADSLETVEVKRRSLERTLTATGTLVPRESVVVTAPIAGTITSPRHSIRDSVAYNDELLTITPFIGNAVVVHASRDGWITMWNVVEGATIIQGQPIAEIATNDWDVSFLVSDLELSTVKEGQRASSRINMNNADIILEGNIRRVEVKKQSPFTTTAQTGATSGWPLRIGIDNVSDDLRRFTDREVDVTMVLDHRVNVLAIDSGAIHRDRDGGTFVYHVPFVTDDFLARAKKSSDITTILEKIPVTTAFEGDDGTEILSGLSEHDTLLLIVPTNNISLFP